MLSLTNHRHLLIPLALFALAMPPAAMATETVVVLDTELIIENKPTPHSPDREPEIRRAGFMTEHLATTLDESAYYEVLDRTKAQDTIDGILSRQQYLYSCVPCQVRIGKEMGADFVVSTWVQVVSNLIINLNMTFLDVEAGEVTRTKFNDIRGNTDNSWRGGTNYMLKGFFKDYHKDEPKAALAKGMDVWSR